MRIIYPRKTSYCWLFKTALSIFIASCMFCPPHRLYAQTKSNAKVHGIILTQEGSAANGVTVQITDNKLLKKSTITNAGGEFYFNALPVGKLNLSLSMSGYQFKIQQVNTLEDQMTEVKDTLQYSANNLETVVVASGGNRFARKESEDVAKMPLKNMENPQVYTVVSKELINEQQLTDYNSAFKNVPGAGVAEVRNQGRTTLISRGFATPQLVRNGVSSFTFATVDPANLERIEVIKGPSATLFGSTISSFGGLFNRVTKKPFENFKGEISYIGGSWNLNRLTADINTPLNKDKTALLRINTALHSESSFQDAGFSKNYLIAPSFSYKLNNRLNLLLDVELSGYKATSPVKVSPIRSSAAGSVEELGIPYRRSFANNTINYVAQQYNIFAQAKYKISQNWTSQSIVSRTRSSSDGYVTALSIQPGDSIRQAVTYQEYPYYGTDIQQNFIGDFKIGSLRNRLVVGLDFYSLKATRNDATVNLPSLSIKKPGEAYNDFTIDKVAPLFEDVRFTNFVSVNERTYSAYASDVLNITDKLLAMASLRVDRYNNLGVYYPNTDSTAGAYSQTAYSPKLGLVYQVIRDRLSLFSNYMNGFNNQSGSDFEGHTFKPSEANQWEAGIKIDYPFLNATLSYYHINVTNMLITDADHPDFNLQNGTQLSQGFEVELISNPLPGLNIIGGFTYNDSKFIHSDPSTLGLRPVTAGPPKTANLWMSYRLVEGRLKGLGLGLGGRYGSEAYQTNTKDFKFTIPAYKILDAALFYDQPKYRIGLKADNLTNAEYWSIRMAPQNPLRITGSLTFKF